jgi:predicted aldo/keto reductase-like oxidoreductase
LETAIQRRKLGKTGLYISKLGYGAMNLRMLKSFDEAQKIVNYVLDQGINFIDTARAYKGEISPNVFNRSLGEDGDLNLLEYIYEKNIGLINMKAFDGNGMVPIYKVISEFISIDYEAMLRFSLSNPYITTVDAGARYVEEYELDIRTALKKQYSSDELTALKDEADKVSVHMKHICRECLHCLEKFECPNKIDFPHILSTYSRYQILDKLGKDTSSQVERYQSFEKNGSDCLECGECLPWCEYKLNIPEMLKQAHTEMHK